MNLGKFRLDQGSAILLITMMLFTGAGLWVNRHYNDPARVVVRSVEKGADRQFRASIEGITGGRGAVARRFRARQAYTPEGGVRLEADGINTYGADRLPYDAMTALGSLADVTDWNEVKREDMYGLGTRHFIGEHSDITDAGNTSWICEYWIDLKTRLPVRVTMSKVVGDPAFGEEDIDPNPLRIYLNIRYFGWE